MSHDIYYICHYVLPLVSCILEARRSQAMKQNDVIKFKHPMPDETNLTMRIIEVNDDRLLVEYLVGMNINPTGIVQLSDVNDSNESRFIRRELINTALRIAYLSHQNSTLSAIKSFVKKNEEL
jgi:hypothetical protein